MTDTEKKIANQKAVIQNAMVLLRRKNETIEQQRIIIQNLEREIALLRINQERAKENVSPLIIEKSKRGK